MVELWAELLTRLPELDVGGEFTAQAMREHLDLDVPAEGASNDELVARLRRLVFDGSIYPGHAGFLAYVSGSGTVPGAAADLIASALNQNLGGFRLSPGANQWRTRLSAGWRGASACPTGPAARWWRAAPWRTSWGSRWRAIVPWARRPAPKG